MKTRRFLILPLSLVVAACSSPRGPYATPRAVDRRPAEAERLTLKAADLMRSQPDEAEALLREALSADLYHGPAHNNLGVLFLNRSELYEAANEFEWARKLMPGHPDPRINLGLTLERAGHIEEAESAYRAALEASSGQIEALQALARLQVRHGREDAGTSTVLKQIAMRGTDETWRAWAGGELSRRTPD